MGSMDIWSWLALAGLPVWIAVWSVIFRGLLEWTTAGKERYRFPIYMGLGIPALLLAAAGPVTMLVRQIERAHVFDTCVTHENADDPLNACPPWTIVKLETARADRRNAK